MVGVAHQDAVIAGDPGCRDLAVAIIEGGAGIGGEEADLPVAVHVDADRGSDGRNLDRSHRVASDVGNRVGRGPQVDVGNRHPIVAAAVEVDLDETGRRDAEIPAGDHIRVARHRQHRRDVDSVARGIIGDRVDAAAGKDEPVFAVAAAQSVITSAAVKGVVAQAPRHGSGLADVDENVVPVRTNQGLAFTRHVQARHCVIFTQFDGDKAAGIAGRVCELAVRQNRLAINLT